MPIMYHSVLSHYWSAMVLRYRSKCGAKCKLLMHTCSNIGHSLSISTYWCAAVCDHWERVTSFSMSRCAMSFVHGFLFSTTLIAPAGCRFMWHGWALREASGGVCRVRKWNFTVQSSASSQRINPTELLICLMTLTPCLPIEIDEFENIHQCLPETGQHDETRSLQTRFLNGVQSFMKVVTELGNPFMSTDTELISLEYTWCHGGWSSRVTVSDSWSWSGPSCGISKEPTRQGDCSRIRHDNKKQCLHACNRPDPHKREAK